MIKADTVKASKVIREGHRRAGSRKSAREWHRAHVNSITLYDIGAQASDEHEAILMTNYRIDALSNSDGEHV